MDAVTNSTTVSSRTLPLFLTRENKYVLGAALFAFASALYLVTNHFHFLPPQELPRTWVDHAVPFMPLTLWIYVSEYVLFCAIFIASNDMNNLNKFFYSFLCLQVLSCTIFWFWPTTYPRGLFPLPEDLDAVTHFAFSSLRETDSPANCCPSLHVSSVYLSAFIYIDEQRKYFAFFFIWATAVAVSTLTTKQHYLVDVVVGFALAVLHYWIFHRKVQYKRLG